MTNHPGCGQCGRPAICSVNNVNLCVDCYSKWQTATSQRQAHAASRINFLMDQADAITGLGSFGSSPRIQIPPPAPIVATQPITLHNINVHGSVVGAINTGEVQQIDVALDHIKLGGDTELAENLKQFTEALLSTTELPDSSKADALEQLSFLSSQAVLPTQERKPGMIRRSLEDISKIVATSTALYTLWEKLHPLLS